MTSMRPSADTAPATGMRGAGGGAGTAGGGTTRSERPNLWMGGGGGDAAGGGIGPTRNPQAPLSSVNGPQYSPLWGIQSGRGGTSSTLPGGTRGAVQVAGHFTGAMASFCAAVRVASAGIVGTGAR